jgi:hypothetical protein
MTVGFLVAVMQWSLCAPTNSYTYNLSPIPTLIQSPVFCEKVGLQRSVLMQTTAPSDLGQIPTSRRLTQQSSSCCSSKSHKATQQLIIATTDFIHSAKTEMYHLFYSQLNLCPAASLAPIYVSSQPCSSAACSISTSDASPGDAGLLPFIALIHSRGLDVRLTARLPMQPVSQKPGGAELATAMDVTARMMVAVVNFISVVEIGLWVVCGVCGVCVWEFWVGLECQHREVERVLRGVYMS